MSNSFLRRYTPPTCTLEIAAKGSPLSRWTDRQVLKQLRFELSFDDPRLPSDQQTKLYGDRPQLDALCEAVDEYVQRLLAQSLSEPLLVPSANGPALLNGLRTPVSVFAPADEAESPAVVAEGGEAFSIAPPAEDAIELNAAGIHLTPHGFLSHDLWLGTLANEDSGASIRLSAVQLFDLATALDDYAAEVLSLPALEHSGWLRSPRRWLPVAAAAVLAVGVTGTLAKFVFDVSNPAMQTATAPATAELEESPAVTALPPTAQTVPTPSAQLGAPSPFQVPPLPPPPPAGTVTPPRAGMPAVTVPRAPAPGTASAPANSSAGIPSRPAQTTVQVPTQPTVIAPPAAPSNGSPAATARIDNGAPDAALPETAALSQGAPAASAPSDGGTAFDTIPQVAEARSYFEERWQPPEGLSQTLEYRLIVGANGSIERIIPLGEAAGNFVDRSQIPLVGEPFVSPLTSASSAQLRVVLSPDGKVRTLLEASN